jgi:hypothetical protein
MTDWAALALDEDDWFKAARRDPLATWLGTRFDVARDAFELRPTVEGAVWALSSFAVWAARFYQAAPAEGQEAIRSMWKCFGFILERARRREGKGIVPWPT